MTSKPSAESFDICNPDGTPAGYSRTRDEAHRLGLWHRTIHVWLIDHGGRTLLQKRSSQKENFPGCWDISCAGHIASGESSLSAALRELREELGLNLDAKLLQLSGETKSENVLHNGDYIDREYHDIYIARVRDLPLSELRFADGEVDDARWIDGNRLEQELRSQPGLFAPHSEEYPLILKWLGAGLSL